MYKSKLKVGVNVVYKNCTCGDGGLIDGNTYEVLKVQYPMFIFIDEHGDKRVRSIETRCFEII